MAPDDDRWRKALREIASGQRRGRLLLGGARGRGRLAAHHVHRRRRARQLQLRLRATRRLLLGVLERRLGRLHRAVPRLDLQHPRRRLPDRDPAPDRDPQVRRSADRRRPRCRPGLPGRAVQHRRSRPDADGRRGRRLGRLPVRDALADPRDPGDPGRHGRRGALGRPGRPAQGPHRRARGDRHDHAQLRRVLPGVLRPLRAEPPPGTRLGQPEVPADEGLGGPAEALRRPLQPAPRLPPGADRRRRRLVDPQPVLPRLPDPRGRREPVRGPQRGHRRRAAPTSS